MSLVGNIRNDAQWLNNMVENLLNMTRISEGELVLKKQPEVVDDVVSEAYPPHRTAERRAGYCHQYAGCGDGGADGRAAHWYRVLVEHLLDNAVKYTPEHAHIDLRAYPDSGYMVFEVSDDGKGIDPSPFWIRYSTTL